jgi:phage terminase large subunit-like protein
LDGRAEFKPKECRRFVTIDPAASSKTTADYTVISTWCVSPWADLVWLGCDRFRATIPDILPRVQAAVRRWAPGWVGIETVGANAAVFQLACVARDPAVPACPIDKGQRDKLVHATRGIVLASTGRVFLPAEGQDASFPREDVLSELVRFTGDEKVDAHDDVVDTLSYAAELMDWVPNTTRGGAPRVLGGAR